MLRFRIFAISLMLFGSAAAARAQTDSLLWVDHSGTPMLRLNSDAGFAVFGTYGSGTIAASGAGARMLWYPGKAAFRAGHVDSFAATYWDDANIGNGSAAFGYATRASGENSFAANDETTASGSRSVALGNNAIASGDHSFSFNGFASGAGSVAIGSSAQCSQDDCIALGPSSIASGVASIVIGPSVASGSFGVAIGLQNSASGNFSVAIGKNARTANRQGSIVLSDGCAGFQADSVFPTANNQFIVRGCGGIKLYTSQLLTSGVEVAAGGGSWSSISDRNRKENFSNVDGEDLLHRLQRVPVMTWNYKTQNTSSRHMGPVAQDFMAAFGLGESNLLINTVDIDGVNMAAIKALMARTEALQKENDELKARLDRLEALLAK